MLNSWKIELCWLSSSVVSICMYLCVGVTLFKHKIRNLLLLMGEAVLRAVSTDLADSTHGGFYKRRMNISRGMNIFEHLQHFRYCFVVQLLSPFWLFVTSWTVACQAPLFSTISPSLLRFVSIELVMLSNRLILCCPLLLLPSILYYCFVYLNSHYFFKKTFKKVKLLEIL